MVSRLWRSFSDTLYIVSKGRLATLLLVLVTIINIFIFPWHKEIVFKLTGGATPIDWKVFYTPHQFQSYIHALGTEGRQHIVLFALTLDLLYAFLSALLIGLFLAALLREVFEETSPGMYLQLVPFMAFFFDVLENIGIVWISLSYPLSEKMLTTATSLVRIASAGKWFFVALSFFALLFCFLSTILFKLFITPTKKKS